MSMMKEFREFAMRGNVVDMAVGIVIGAAFGKIVSSFVSDIILPPLGMLTGGVDLSTMVIVLQEATDETAAVTLNYGIFINTIIDFIIIAFAIFIVIKQMNRFRAHEERKEAPKGPTEVELLTDIRDSLKNK